MKIHVVLIVLLIQSIFTLSLAVSANESGEKSSLSQQDIAWTENDGVQKAFKLIEKHFKRKQYQTVDQILTRLLNVDTITISQQAQVYRLQAKVMMATQNFTQQQTLVENAKRIATKLQDNQLKTRLFATLGKLKLSQFKLTEAQYFYLQAIASTEDESILPKVYEELGISYAQQGQFADATDAMLKAVHIHQQNNQPVPSALYNNLGGLALYTQDWGRAIEFLTLAIEDMAQGSIAISDAYSNLGNAFFQKNDLPQAQRYFQKSIEITDQLGEKNLGTRNNLAYVFLKQGDYQKALPMFKKVEAFYLEQEDAASLAVAKKNIGETHVALGQYPKADTYFSDAYAIYIEHDYRPKLLELYPLMIDNSEKIGHLSRALTLLKEFKEISDDTLSVSSKERIAKLQSAYDLEKKSKELAESEKARADLAHQKALKEKKLLELKVEKQEQQRSIYLLIAAIGALAIAGGFLIRINTLRANTNTALQRKNKEIAENHNELERLNAQLALQSTEDALTGLKNRRFLEQFLPREQARIQREMIQSGFKPSLVIMLDIDHFKHINDTYGHAAGDTVLQIFADILRSNARTTDIQVRWGGEEFLWYCPETSFTDGQQLCSRIRAQLKTSIIDVGEAKLSPTCSFGFVTFPSFGNPETDWEASLKIADAALYKAKALGRDRWVGARINANDSAQTDGEIDIEHCIEKSVITFVDW